MTTFVLKKYEHYDTNDIDKNDKEMNKTKDNNVTDEDTTDEVKISVNSSIAEIMHEILYKRLKNNVSINKVDEEENSDYDIKAVSTEEINNNPLDTFNFIKRNDVVFILNRGFRTKEDEWFLVNLENKTNKVIYTVESFIKFIKNKLKIQCIE